MSSGHNQAVYEQEAREAESCQTSKEGAEEIATESGDRIRSGRHSTKRTSLIQLYYIKL